ncbi:MAG: ribbon-helix-helix protein, CopG family [Archaeoglobaceae archaeon]
MVKYKRLSVAVDESIIDVLNRLTTAQNKTVSDIIRESILAYAELAEGGTRLTDLKHYEKILERRDHVLIDLEVWIAILDFVNSKADDEFWKLIENIGYEIGMEFKLRDLDLSDVLEHFQFGNVLSFTEEGGIFILTLVSRSATNMFLRILKGILKALQIDAEVIPGVRKIVVVDKSRLRDKSIQNWIEEMGKSLESSE